MKKNRFVVIIVVCALLFFAGRQTIIKAHAMGGGGGGGGCSGTPITFTGQVDLDFDVTTGTAGTGTIDMGSNGTITYGVGYTGGGTGVAGVFVINGTINCNVSIACDATMTLTDSGGNPVTVPVLKFAIRLRGHSGRERPVRELAQILLQGLD